LFVIVGLLAYVNEGYSCGYVANFYMAGKYCQCDVADALKYFYAAFVVP
jgi:hypothetical protein